MDDVKEWRYCDLCDGRGYNWKHYEQDEDEEGVDYFYIKPDKIICTKCNGKRYILWIEDLLNGNR